MPCSFSHSEPYFSNIIFKRSFSSSLWRKRRPEFKLISFQHENNDSNLNHLSHWFAHLQSVLLALHTVGDRFSLGLISWLSMPFGISAAGAIALLHIKWNHTEWMNYKQNQRVCAYMYFSIFVHLCPTFSSMRSVECSVLTTDWASHVVRSWLDLPQCTSESTGHLNPGFLHPNWTLHLQQYTGADEDRDLLTAQLHFLSSVLPLQSPALGSLQLK